METSKKKLMYCDPPIVREITNFAVSKITEMSKEEIVELFTELSTTFSGMAAIVENMDTPKDGVFFDQVDISYKKFKNNRRK